MQPLYLMRVVCGGGVGWRVVVVAVVGVVDGGSGGWWWRGLVAVNTKSEILKLKIYKIQKILDARRCVQHIKIMQGRKIHKYLQYWQATRIRYTKPKEKYKIQKILDNCNIETF